MKFRASLTVAVVLLASTWLLGQEPRGDDEPGGRDAAKGDVEATPPSLFPDGYLDHDALGAALKEAAAANPKALKVDMLAKSAQGRDVWIATLGRATRDGAKPGDAPAILIAANLEADHLVGSEVALGLIERLAKSEPGSDGAKWLDTCTVYIVPRLNPDGAERVLKGTRVETRLNDRPVDRDRDGQAGEDGPDDLDGDGLITRMRVKDDEATLIADEKDPRLLRKADPIKGETPVYSLRDEGKDDDGDGLVNEDGPGGVNLNRNWPHRWTEFDPESGTSPASEPETNALIRFAFDHPEIAVVWTFGLNDTIKSEPRKPASTIADADLPLFVELSKLYTKATTPEPAKGAEAKKDEPKKDDEAKKDEPADEAKPDTPPAPADRARLFEQFKNATPEERAKMAAQFKGAAGGRGQGGGGRGGRGGPGGGGRGGGGAAPTPAGSSLPDAVIEPTTDGAMSEWAYHQFGVVGIASRLWEKPEIPEPAKGEPAPPADGEARWLYWNDHVMDGRAYVEPKEADHPTFGKVLIGGWKPGVRLNPPAGELDALADAHATFLEGLAGKLPRLEIVSTKVEAKGGGLFEIKATVANTGYLPTALSQGVRTREAAPVLVRLELGGAKLLAGDAFDRIDTLGGSGGRREYRWLVLAPASVKSVTLEAKTAKAGRASKEISLQAD